MNETSNLQNSSSYDYTKTYLDKLQKLYFKERYNIKEDAFDGRTFQQIFDESQKLVLNSGDWYLASFFVISFVSVYVYLGINEFVKVAENNFENYKCDPRYILFNGYIKPKDGQNGFQSTGEYFQECVKGLSSNTTKSKLPSLNSYVSALSESTLSNIDNVKSTLSGLNKFTDSTFNILQDNQKNNDKENSKTAVTTYYSLDVVQKMNALNVTISEFYKGIYTTTQSGMTFVYTFFEGALIRLAAITTFIFVIAVLCIVFFNFPLAVFLFILATAFLCIFIAVVIVMLIYASFLKNVFGINVKSKNRVRMPKSKRRGRRR